MIHFSGQNDVYRLQTTAARDGLDFHLAYIGRDFDVEHRTDFDPTYIETQLRPVATPEARSDSPVVESSKSVASVTQPRHRASGALLWCRITCGVFGLGIVFDFEKSSHRSWSVVVTSDVRSTGQRGPACESRLAPPDRL
jgi:hypothetical protein